MNMAAPTGAAMIGFVGCLTRLLEKGVGKKVSGTFFDIARWLQVERWYEKGS